MKSNSIFTLKAACKLMAVAGMTAGLAACGGSAASSSTYLTLSGTAAIGAALSGATVTVTCASGTGTATADGNGAYSLNIYNGKGPCLITATSGGVTLHSFASGPGNYNVTPLTDMLTTYLAIEAGTTPGNLLSTGNGLSILSNSNAITQGEQAIANIVATDYGVTLSTSNFLQASITPGANGATGSQTDTDLDNLLKAGVLNSNGTVSPSATVVITVVAQLAPPYVPPTGA